VVTNRERQEVYSTAEGGREEGREGAESGIGNVSRWCSQEEHHVAKREERSTRDTGQDILVILLGEAGISSAHDHVASRAEAAAGR
jgi:hypothetical protein